MGDCKDANSVLEEGCEGTTFERKYYRSGISYTKRTLRKHEFKMGHYGLYTPRLSYERLQNEAACLRFVADMTNIPVPEVFADFEDDGAFYLVTRYIDGVLMNDLPEDDKATINRELENYLQSLHNLKSDKVGGPSGLVVPPRPVMEKTNQDEWLPQSSDTEGFIFCHNDLSEYNIIVDPENLKIKAIIDWEYGGFYPAFFESPIYTRQGPKAQVANDEERVSRMIEFLGGQKDH